MPRLSRASTFLLSEAKDVDGRVKPGHDGDWVFCGPCFLHIASQLMYLDNAPVTLRRQNVLMISGEFRCRSIRM
jgi:hypothetical protein